MIRVIWQDISLSGCIFTRPLAHEKNIAFSRNILPCFTLTHLMIIIYSTANIFTIVYLGYSPVHDIIRYHEGRISYQHCLLM